MRKNVKRILAGKTKKLLSLLLSAVLVLGLVLPALEVEAAADNSVDWNFYMGYEKPTALLLDELETKITYPDSSEYLDEFRLSYIRSSKSGTGVWHINAYTSTKASKNSMTVPDGSPVLVLACSGDFCCVVDYTQSKAGWVRSENLDDNYYGRYDPICQDVEGELASWRDIASLHVSGGAITGIKTDGSLVSLRFSENGENFANWGKVKNLFSRGPVTYGVTADGTIRIYSDQELFYPDRTRDELEDGTKLSDCRFVKNVQKIIGDLDTGLLCLSDGQLNYVSGKGMLAERPYGFDESFLYYDANRKAWCFVDCSGDSKQLYIQNKDGTFDWDNGKDVTNRSDYQFSAIAKNITDIAGDCPFAGGFTALRKDGSLIIYGEYLTSKLVGSYGEHYDLDYTFLKNYLNIGSLVDDQLYLNKEKQLVCLDDVRSMAQGKSSEKPFERWENIVSACYQSDALFAVDTKGQVRTYVEEGSVLDEELLAVSDWRDVVSVTVCTDMELNMTLGLTRDGRVLCSGSTAKAGLPAFEEMLSFSDDMYILDMSDVSIDLFQEKMDVDNGLVKLGGNGSSAAFMAFKKGIKDCVYLSMLIILSQNDSNDYSSVAWQSMVHLKDDGWYPSVTWEYTGKIEEACMYAKEPVTVDALIVAPSEELNSVFSYSVAFTCTQMKIGFATKEAAYSFYNTLSE